jgi:hypothetical protein
MVLLPSESGMSKKSKREQKIRNNTKGVSLNDFEALITDYGRIEMGAKHAKAIIRTTTLMYKRANPVPYVYVEDLLKLIDNQ